MESWEMGKIVLAMGVPHAPQLVSDPQTWGEIYELVTCASQIGKKAELDKETLADNISQYEAVKKSFSLMEEELSRTKPNAIISLTDDHFDNFFLDDYPAFSVFLGDEVDGSTIWLPNRKFNYSCDSKLERTILEKSIDAGFDLSFSEEVHLEYGHLVPLSYLLPKADLPLVPIYTNAYASPNPSPERCLKLGGFLREVVERHTPADYKVAILASGGMSHYPGEPLGGEIDVEFDKKMMEWLKNGENRRFGELTSKQIDESGNTEMRNWIVMLGALGDSKPAYANYIISWRAIIGLGFLMWKSFA